MDNINSIIDEVIECSREEYISYQEALSRWHDGPGFYMKVDTLLEVADRLEDEEYAADPCRFYDRLRWSAANMAAPLVDGGWSSKDGESIRREYLVPSRELAIVIEEMEALEKDGDEEEISWSLFDLESMKAVFHKVEENKYQMEDGETMYTVVVNTENGTYDVQTWDQTGVYVDTFYI